MRLVAIHRPLTALLAAILLFVGTALIALPAEPAGAAGGQISGVVTNAAGEGLGGVFVYASGVTGGFGGSATTAADGTYLITNVQPGTYRVAFSPPSGSPYVWAVYLNKTSFADATPVTVTEGATVIVSQRLELAGAIEGVVEDEAGAPIEGIGVTVERAPGGDMRFATTTSTGFYRVGSLHASDYLVKFAPAVSVPLFPEWFSDAPDRNSASPIAVAVGEVEIANATLAPSGAIEGVVTNDDGAPINGIPVRVHSTGLPSLTTTTTSTGYYRVGQLVDAAYRLEFAPQPVSVYFGEWWDDKPDAASATPIEVTVPNHVVANATLARTASVSGVVTGEGLGPLSGTEVVVQPIGSAWSRSAYTTSTGYYVVGGLTTGDYKVQFKPPWNSDFLEEWWENKPDAGSATAVRATVPDDTRLDAQLARGGSIDGRITSLDGSPIMSATVTVQSLGSSPRQWWRVTGADGRYHVGGLKPGSYKVQFIPPYNSAFIGEWWDDATSEASATAIVIDTNETETANAALDRFARITGTVTLAGSGPAALTSVRLTNTATNAQFWSSTNADGTWAANVPAGSYLVWFFPPYGSGFVGEYWDDVDDAADATLITVASGDMRTLLTTLERTGEIRGRVTDATGAGIAGVTAIVWGGNSYVYRTATTDVAGDYVVTGLGTGNFTIFFSAPSPYRSEYFDDVTNQADAQLVASGRGMSFTANATLARWSVIEGTVTDTSGAPIGGAHVWANNGSMGYSTWSGTDGTYELLVGAGTYKVGYSATGYLTEYFDDATWWSDATPVVVGANATVTVDEDLVRAATITGTVTSNGGAPIANTAVYATRVGSSTYGYGYTGIDGTYTITNLVPGDYHIAFYPPSGYLFEYHAGKASYVDADVVTLTAGSTATIDATLDQPGTIQGVVTDASGNPIEWAAVSVVDSRGSSAGFAYTSSTGAYSINQLRPGSYTVSASSSIWDFPAQSTVTVSSGSTEHVDFALTRGGRFEGTVRSRHAASAGSVSVAIYSKAGGLVASTDVLSDGSYASPLLLPGKYIVEFVPAADNRHQGEYWDNANRFDQADAVKVRGGESLAHIDAILSIRGSDVTRA